MRALLATMTVLLVAGCGERPSLKAGETCNLNSDCESPLVCRLERCRRECAQTRDCPAGQVCLVNARGLGACEVPEDECTESADCPEGLVCRVNQCTNACATHDDCPSGARCDLDEASGVMGCVDPADTGCERNSDCAAPLICATDELCREQCKEDRDCRDGASCVPMGEHLVCAQASLADAGPGLDATTVGDAGIDGGLDAGFDAGFDAGADGGADAGPGAFGPTTSHVFVGGSLHTCAIGPAGAMSCWGLNANGQLGDGTTTNSSVPVAVLTGVVEATAGGRHTCARSATALWCWGDNNAGQLGDATTAQKTTPTGISLAFTAASLDRISAGDEHTCVLDTTGRVFCWGQNADGQLGDASFTPSSVPVEVTGLAGTPALVDVDGNHGCALLTDGRIQCWGDNLYGQLGDGTNTDSNLPVLVTGITTAEEVSLGNNHTCARLADGTARCWGWNLYGQLGDGSGLDSSTPVTVAGLAGVTQVAAGLGFTCARSDTGAVSCWGDNFFYQLGINRPPTSSPAAVTATAAEAVEMGAGTYHTCIRTLAGLFQCWGRNNFGQLGDGTTTSTHIPVTVSL